MKAIGKVTKLGLIMVFVFVIWILNSCGINPVNSGNPLSTGEVDRVQPPGAIDTLTTSAIDTLTRMDAGAIDTLTASAIDTLTARDAGAIDTLTAPAIDTLTGSSN